MKAAKENVTILLTPFRVSAVMNAILRETSWMFRPACVVFLLCMVEGCYTTVVRVNTVPPGSTLHFDYQPKGVTPTEFETDWYGKHKLTLDHPQYGRRVESIDLKAPAHLWFPFDLFVALLPFKVTDRHDFSFDMTQEPTPEKEANRNESEGAK